MMTGDTAPPGGETCATCLHWRPERSSEQGIDWGQCRRMPPTMPPIQDDKLVHVGVWPHTQETDWCGEWTSRTAAAES